MAFEYRNNVRQGFGIFGLHVGVAFLNATNTYLRDNVSLYPLLGSQRATRLFCLAALLATTTAAGLQYGDGLDRELARPRMM